ncbi:MAG: DUF11 domain-containing protein [Anaerolineae bacterium]
MNNLKRLAWVIALLLSMLLLSFGFLRADRISGTVEEYDHFIYLPVMVKPPPQADLALDKVSHPFPYEAGEAITYTLTLTNLGPSAVEAVTLTETLPGVVLSPTFTTTTGSYDSKIGAWVSLNLTSGHTATLTVVGMVSSTFTRTLWSSTIVTPVVAIDPDLSNNRVLVHNPEVLLNPGFEDEHWGETYYGWNGGMSVPKHWIAWWTDDASEGLGGPESVRVIDDSIPAYREPIPRIRSGHRAVKISRSERWEAGFYQRVEDLPVGSTVTFSVYAHAWSCNERYPNPPATSCGDPWEMWFRVGIDPGGAEDPWSEDIVWSDNAYIYDAFEPVGPITATVGQDGAVTVYLYARAKWIQWYNEAYWDDAELIVQP